MIETTVAALAERVGGELRGDGSVVIRGVGDLRGAMPDQICFVRSERYAKFADQSGAGALIVNEPLDLDVPQIVVSNSDVAFAVVATFFFPRGRATEHRVEPSAVVAEDAELDEPVEIWARVVVEAGARVGAGSVLHAGAVVSAGAVIGRDCVLHPHVVLYPGVRLGDRVVVHAGTVLGADGFGYAREEPGRWIKVPQIGTVEIGDDVEIGANCAIDRGALGATRIGARSKIDNSVHVGHNCVFGEDVAIAAASAFSGSTTLGDRVVIGGHVVSAGHLSVCDDARIGGNSVLRLDVTEPGEYMGYPLLPLTQWGRTIKSLAQLSELRSRIQRLEWELGSGPSS